MGRVSEKARIETIIGDKARHDDFFPVIEIQEPAAKSTTQNEYNGDRGKKSPGFFTPWSTA